MYVFYKLERTQFTFSIFIIGNLVTSNGVESTFASGLTNARGLAFDDAGNLFAAESTTVSGGDILKFTPGETESVSPPVAVRRGSLSSPDRFPIRPDLDLVVLGVEAIFGLNFLLHRRSEVP